MRGVFLFLCIVLSATGAAATGGFIGVYSDPGGRNCQILDKSAGLLSLYVVHTQTVGATASQFQAAIPPCMTGATYLSDTAIYPVTLGDSQAGVAVAYGPCLSAPIHVLTINVFGSGISPACCRYRVKPDTEVLSGEIEVVDCGSSIQFASGLSGIVNGDASCDCNEGLQEGTWGKVKHTFTDF